MAVSKLLNKAKTKSNIVEYSVGKLLPPISILTQSKKLDHKT